MEKVAETGFSKEEQRVAWEGLAASCSAPLRRLGAFSLVGFVSFVAASTAVVLFFNLFGESPVEGGGVAVPPAAFYGAMLFGLCLTIAGYAAWLWRSLRSYNAFATILRRGGLDPRRPTAGGLGAYSDEQLLALRSRYERLSTGSLRRLMGLLFGFRDDDSFSLAPLSALPGTFEMDVLRVEWETNLILSSADTRDGTPGDAPGDMPGGPAPEVSWWVEGRHRLLPRRTDELQKLVYAMRYTGDSVRELKRRYGLKADRWHRTIPEGKLFDAVRDYESARRIRASLYRRTRG